MNSLCGFFARPENMKAHRIFRQTSFECVHRPVGKAVFRNLPHFLTLPSSSASVTPASCARDNEREPFFCKIPLSWILQERNSVLY